MKLLNSIRVMLICLGASTKYCLAADSSPQPADNAFMMICTVLVLFMTLPGIALFYGGLIRGKNILSLMTQTMVTFSLTCVLWVCYGYSITFSPGNAFFGDSHWVLLRNIPLKASIGSLYQYIHVAYQASFACITVALVMGALAEELNSLQ